jgi:hypothetical protein
MLVDEKSGTSLWKEAEAKEIEALMNYIVFKDLGRNGTPPPRYNRI